MHTSLRVTGVLSGVESSVVVGFGFCGWDSAEAVHQPESVVDRVNSPYPSTSDPQYGAAIQALAKDLLGTGDDVLFGLIDRAALEHLTRLDPQTLQPLDRARLE